MKPSGSGTLVIKLEYNTKVVHGARIAIPLMGIDEHMGKMLRLDHIPAGTYDATLTIYQTTGGESKKPIKLKIHPDQDNIHEYNLSAMPKEIIIRPVDSNSQTVLMSELRIENVDPNFRLVRDEKGIAFKLRPGEYLVKIILPDLQVKAYPLTVTEDTYVYTLPIDQAAPTRHEARVQLSIPVAYKGINGEWVTTNTTNISATGICLVKGQGKINNEQLFLRLFLPISSSPLECYAKIKWINDQSNTKSRVGLQLDLPDQIKSSLGKWIQDRKKP